MPRGTKVLPLLEYIVQQSPRYERPHHLQQLVDVLEGIARGETHRVVVHTPPRHGKTETLLHAIPWLVQQHPEWTIGYSSYNEDITRSKSRVALQLAERVGIPFDTATLEEWRTPNRGGCLSRGIGGALTGQGINVGIIDDPIKNRVEAESALRRKTVWEWFTDVFYTRLEPGSSVIVNMARWHPDDLAGKLVKEYGWRYIRLPAIDDNGNALWPERWNVESLLGPKGKKETLGPYSWESLFQGNPRPRGGAVFGDVWCYSSIPEGKRRTAIGLDFAYTAKTSSDHSALVVMALIDNYYYVLDVVRAQVRAPVFLETVKRYRKLYPHARMRWYAAGTEVGAADFMKEPERDLDDPKRRVLASGLPIEVLKPNGDKFVRAISYSAAWNATRVLVPEDADRHPWVTRFVEEHSAFTGVNDDEDDQVDAAVAAYDILESQPGGYEGVPETARDSETRRRL